ADAGLVTVAVGGSGSAVLAPVRVHGEAVMTAIGIDLRHNVDRRLVDKPLYVGGAEPALADRDPPLVMPGRNEPLGECDQDVGAAPLACMEATEQHDGRRLFISAADPDRMARAAFPG